MVSAKLFQNEEEPKNKSGGLLEKEDVKTREEFLLDPYYPPRPKRSYKKPFFTLLAFILLGSIAVSAYFLVPIIKKEFFTSPRTDYNRDFNKFLNKFRNNRKSFDLRPLFPFKYNLFVENWDFIQECNKNNPGVNFSINQFANWGEEKMRDMLLTVIDSRIEDASFPPENVYKIDSEAVPDSFDWRNSKSQMVTPVKNQGNCGSCWAFSVVAAIETQYAMKKGALLSLSEQELVDCEVTSSGCSGGYLATALAFIHEKGLETEEDYPYIGIQQKQCSIQSEKIQVRIDNAYRLRADEDYIANWVANYGPVSFLMPVPKSIMFYSSGIFKPSFDECRKRAIGVHAMAIVGFGREGNQKYWIVKNSWATTWGEQGYLRMARGVNICGFTDYVYAPQIN